MSAKKPATKPAAAAPEVKAAAKPEPAKSEPAKEVKVAPMQYRRLGKTGLKVSRICLGTMGFGSKNWMEWCLEEEESSKIIEAAWKAGINFFDTADMYSNGVSETILGNAIKKFGIPRDEIVIATKVFNPMSKPKPLNADAKQVQNSIDVNHCGLSRKHIFDAVDASLKRLGVDYIDLYQIHRWDNETPIEETMKALHDLVVAGKIRYIGASTMHAWQFAKAQHVAVLNRWTPFVTMQNLYNLIYREEEREVIPMCADQGVGILPWSPLAGGYLAGKRESVRKLSTEASADFFDGWYDDETAKILDAVTQVAEKRKVPNAEVALAWVLSKDYVSSPIIGCSKLSQLYSSINALSLKLTEEEIQSMESLYKPRKLIGWHR